MWITLFFFASGKRRRVIGTDNLGAEGKRVIVSQ